MTDERRKIRQLENKAVKNLAKNKRASIYFNDVKKTPGQRTDMLFAEMVDEDMDLARVEGLLRIGVDFSVKKDGLSLSQQAIELEKIGVLELLMKYNANPDEADDAGHTLLMRLSRHYGPNAWEMSRILVNAAARLETCGPEGKTALELAFWRCNYPVSLRLWSSGANASRIMDMQDVGPCSDTSSEHNNEILMPKLLGAILSERESQVSESEKNRSEIEHHGISLQEPVESLGQIKSTGRRVNKNTL